MLVLNEILKPFSPKVFFENYWLNEAVYISSMGERKFDQIFSWEDLNHLLNFSESDRSAVELIVEGKSLTMQGINTGDLVKGGNLRNFFQKGATLKINQIHKRMLKELFRHLVLIPKLLLPVLR